jgi:hypothetical protein
MAMKSLKILTWCDTNGELPLFLSSYTRSYECLIVSKRYSKLLRPKVCILSPTTTPIRLLQKRLTRYMGWIMLVHPRVILPDGFWDIIESECTDPEVLYGAETLLYDNLDTPHYDPFESDDISCNGYFQIYHNGRYPPGDKIYSAVKPNPDTLFRDRWPRCHKLPMYIKFIL